MKLNLTVNEPDGTRRDVFITGSGEDQLVEHAALFLQNGCHFTGPNQGYEYVAVQQEKALELPAMNFSPSALGSEADSGDVLVMPKMHFGKRQ